MNMPSNDLISRKAVLDALRAKGKEIVKLGKSFGYNIASINTLECVNIVKDIPAAIEHAPVTDAEQVPHARWKPHSPGDVYACSRCGYGLLVSAHFQNRECIKKGGNNTNYCSNCGAKMDKEGKG